jgi:hypothetical protein
MTDDDPGRPVEEQGASIDRPDAAAVREPDAPDAAEVRDPDATEAFDRDVEDGFDPFDADVARDGRERPAVEVTEPVDPTWDDVATGIPAARADRTDLPPLEPGYEASRARFVAWLGRIVHQPVSSWLTLLIVAGASAFIISTLHVDLLFRNTTPTGGDMGAHVWGPMYMLRHLLPHGEVTCWTPDWSAGFPAFGYYMVGPAIAIVGVHVGASGLLAVPAALAALAVAVSGFVVRRLFSARKVLLVVGLVLVVLSIPVPYNIAFKLVTVIGLVTMPISAWAFAKLADLRFPAPPAFAIAALVFVYNREPLVRYPNGGAVIGTGNIIGGNMLSTMAGEYSFSIALSLSLVYLGVLVRGLRTGRHRGLAAGLLALVGLCHLLPFFFVLLATALILLIRPSWGRVKWLLAVGPVAAALAAFWMLPFYWYRTYTVDMGFEQLPPSGRTYADYLFPDRITWIFLLAGVGVVVAFAYRNRIGQWLLACAVATAVAFRFMPQIQLWNARILPFYYLSVILLAAFGASGVIFAISTLLSTRRGRVNAWTASGLMAIAALAGVAFVGFPLHNLPGQHDVGGKSTWLAWSTTDSNPASSWASWNYTGYEGRTNPTPRSQNPYAEYRALITTMANLGNDPAHGCGRAMWEADNDREGDYGTPMALMLLPYWTDSCIGSMEGLYFESSATTPYHFIDAAQLSNSPSNPMRGLPYPGLDVAGGVAHLQLLGVKYYLADSSTTIAQAAQVPALTEVAVSGPWHVYQIADSALVEPLTHEPVVWNVKDQAKSSVQPGVAWYLDPTRWDTPFASSGPASWKRVKVDVSYWDHRWSTLTDIVTQISGKKAPIPLPRVTTPKVPAVKVTDIASTTDTISFDVDRVGVPVKVKSSYFPNWSVKGAKGPYRITPNQMVVIPTSTHVELHYQRTSVDWLADLLFFVGLAALVWLARRPAVAVASPLWARLGDARRTAARAAGERRASSEEEPPPGGWPDDPADGTVDSAVDAADEPAAPVDDPAFGPAAGAADGPTAGPVDDPPAEPGDDPPAEPGDGPADDSH